MACSLSEMPAKGKSALHYFSGSIENGIATPPFIKHLRCS
jgi:hypothetical protein